MIVLTLKISHAVSWVAAAARRGEALPEWALGKVTPGAGMKPRAPPGGSGDRRKFRSARIKPFTATERRDPKAASQNVRVGLGANWRRLTPPALKYHFSERALLQMHNKPKQNTLLARSSDSLASHSNLTRSVLCLCSQYLLSLLVFVGRFFFFPES